MLQVRFLTENKTEDPRCDGEFGLSMKITTDERTILFDTGFSDMLLRNAANLGESLEQVDCCVLSHSHDDHTNGAPHFLKVNGHAPVYLHRAALIPSYDEIKAGDSAVAGVATAGCNRTAGASDAPAGCAGSVDDPIGCPGDEQIGLQWDPADYPGRILLTEEPVWLTRDIVISGTIPPEPGFVPTEHFLVKDGNGGYVHDPMDHEQFLAIRGRDGIYLFSGCSHKGIAAAMDYAKVLFPGAPLAGVIAGLHLSHADTKTRQAVIDRLAAENLKVVIPMHCTGLEALVMMKTQLGGRCLLASAGKKFRLE